MFLLRATIILLRNNFSNKINFLIIFAKGGKMKKGIYGLSILFLVICCSQEASANVTLNVNAKNSTLANKIYYSDSASKLVTVTLPWKEKAVYGGDGEVVITVNNKLKGDLIIKIDILSSVAGAMAVSGAWLKYGSTTGPFSTPSKVIEITADGGTPTGGTPIDKTDLTTLCLEKTLAANTTITLMDFFTKFSAPSHIIFTAVLLDDAAAVSPQVQGVDVQTVFFNYVDTTITPVPAPIWLKLAQSD